MTSYSPIPYAGKLGARCSALITARWDPSLNSDLQTSVFALNFKSNVTSKKSHIRAIRKCAQRRFFIPVSLNGLIKDQFTDSGEKKIHCSYWNSTAKQTHTCTFRSSAPLKFMDTRCQGNNTNNAAFTEYKILYKQFCAVRDITIVYPSIHPPIICTGHLKESWGSWEAG